MKDFKRLKHMVSIPAVLHYYGLTSQIRSKPGGYVGPCPIHKGDNKRAFHINKRGHWYCFTQCQTGGDLVEFIRRLEGGRYDRVALVLETVAHQGPPPAVLGSSYSATGKQKIKAMYHQNSQFIPFTRSLNLIHQHPRFTRLGLKKETLVSFEAGLWTGQGFLKKCLAVRIHDAEGKPLTYMGRRLDPDEIDKWGKWKMPRNFKKQNSLFNYHRARKHAQKSLIIVEGPWDVMKIAQAGYQNVVALLGTTISQQQITLLKDTPHLILMFDGDQSGRNAIHRAVHLIGEKRTTVIHVPNEQDPATIPEHELKTLLFCNQNKKH